MGNDNAWARYAKLQIMIGKMCLDGSRRLDDFIEVQQNFVSNSRWSVSGTTITDTESSMGPKPSILTLVNPNIKVSVRDRFVVADNFKKGVAGIYYVGNNFQKWFGSMVETNVPAGALSSRKLLERSLDDPIKTELGEGHEAFFAWLFEKIEAQSDGREGELLVDGRANIFYVYGRVVVAGWDAGIGWRVGARGVAGPCPWDADDLVFSRNSVLESLETLVPAQA